MQHSPQHAQQGYHQQQLPPPACLIADDSIVIAKTLSRCVESRGWQSMIVHNGQDALRALVERPWDAVFLDDQMPILSGHDAILQFRQWEALNRPTRQTGVFFITGSGPGGIQSQGQALAPPAGFEGVVDGVFIKPLNMAQLGQLLDSIAAARVNVR